MMPETTPPEAVARFSEESSPILRLGKDEMNLAEFPITLLTDRVPKGQKIIQYQDQIYDEKTGRTITRKLTISASEGYGLPTAVDDDVILALIQLTKTANNFTAKKVEFSRLDLIKMLGWPDSGFSYKRVATSLKRWLGVSLVYENAWWDKRQQAWTTKGFHILDNFELNDSRTTGGQSELFPSSVVWNEAVFESFQSGYLKTIDYEMYIRLEHPTAKRMYRFLSKRMYHRPDWVFDLCDLAFEHIGLSRNYNGNAGKIKEKLQPAIDELETAGFLEPMSKEDRYQKDGKHWKIRLVQKASALPTPSPQTSEPEPSPLVAELTKRGVTRSTAAELVQRHPAKIMESKIDVFDWLTEKQDKRVAKSPAGYLVASIEKDYAAPKGYVSKAERLKREEAQRQAEQKAAEDRRRKQEEGARQKAEQEEANAYWAKLTPQQQVQLDAEVLAQASEEQRQTYETLKRLRGGEGYLKMLRIEYIHALMHRQTEPA